VNGETHDSRFNEYRAGARAAGLRFGAYGVVYPSGDVEAQARAFCRAYVPTDDDLPPVLDWEVHGRDEHGAAVRWVRFVEHVTGRECVIYTGKGFTDSVKWPADSPLAKRELWTAHYTSAARPLVPSQWAGRFAAWQYSGDGGERVAGCRTDIDRDVFAKDEDGDGDVDDRDVELFVERSKVGEPHPLPTAPPLATIQRLVGASPDGRWGPQTERCLRAWQATQGLAATGQLDDATIDAVVTALAPAVPEMPRAESIVAPL
jgi:peptidoglycan hydrolase-like protein with peptidoglycan-binding domain